MAFPHDNNQIIDGCYAPEKPRYPYPAKLDINGLITFLSENPTIRQLDLSTHRLSVENIRDLCEYLTRPDCQVIELNLYQTGLTDAHLNIFSGMLMKEHSLKVLRVGGNHRLTLEAVQLFEKQLGLYDQRFILFDWDYFNYDTLECCCFKKKKGKKLNKQIKQTTISNWEKMTTADQQMFSTGGCLSEATRSMLPQVSNAYAVSPTVVQSDKRRL